MPATPTVLAIETDSAWVVILAVCAATLAVALILRRVIGTPGGMASGLLLLLPLALPLIAAAAYAHAVLPEISVWQPIGQALKDPPRDLLHILLVADERARIVTPYAFSGSAGQWILLIGLSFSSLMLLRRALGTVLIRRILARCTPAQDAQLQSRVARLAQGAGLKQTPELMLLPDGIPGAFAVGLKRQRILLAPELVAALDPDELEGILAHEIAHLESRDVPLVFSAGLMRDVMAWNPIAHLAFRILMRDRELEADRRAAAATNSPLAVASGLLKACELLRKAPYHRRFALGFLTEGSRVKQRVSTLIAAADGRVPLVGREHLPYLMAVCLVILFGLQVGARVAQDNPGAVMITWGNTDTSERTWFPEDSRALRREPVIRTDHPPKREVEKVKPQLFAGPANGGSVRMGDVKEWFAAMERWTKQRRAAFVRMSWKSRQNWEATPLFAFSMGPLDIYKVVPYPF